MVRGINKIMILLFARNEWNMIHACLIVKIFQSDPCMATILTIHIITDQFL